MASSTSSSKGSICILLSTLGNDPTEIVTPYEILSSVGYKIEFATEDGKPATCDPRMTGGVVGSLLGATAGVKSAYRELIATSAWSSPLDWSSSSFSLVPYDAILLPGGHDKPMRQYLESQSLSRLLGEYFPLCKGDGVGKKRKVVGAICHGVLALARAKEESGTGVLSGIETTTLPVFMEKGIYIVTAPFLGTYYRTYSAYTADEVQSLLAKPEDYKSGGFLNSAPFVHKDPNSAYISARFPGDAKLFGEEMEKLLSEELAKA